VHKRIDEYEDLVQLNLSRVLFQAIEEELARIGGLFTINIAPHIVSPPLPLIWHSTHNIGDSNIVYSMSVCVPSGSPVGPSPPVVGSFRVPPSGSDRRVTEWRAALHSALQSTLRAHPRYST